MKPLVIYDGECNICAGNLPWLHRLDWFRIFDDLPYQSPELHVRHPQIRPEDCERALHVIFPNGKIYTGFDATREVFLRMPLTCLIGLVMAIPPLRQILRRLYPILARNRYRIGGKCKLKAVPNGGTSE